MLLPPRQPLNAVPGGLSGQRDESSHKWFLTRDSAPAGERFRSPSIEEREAQGLGGQPKGR